MTSIRSALIPSLILLGASACGNDDTNDSATASETNPTTVTMTSPTTTVPTTSGTGDGASATTTTTTDGSASASAESSGTGDVSTGSTAGDSSSGDSSPLLDVGADTDPTGDTGEIVTCDDAANKPSNFGCEFWAVDMDQQDGFNDPASAPWGVAISPAGFGVTDVFIEINLAPPGMPLDLMLVKQISIGQDEVVPVELPTRELDCGVMPNDYKSPGTCLSSNAFRITSTAPIVVYQFNVFKNAFSNDASLLLPTPALGKRYRVLGWPAGHPIKILDIIDRSAVTIVGTTEDTSVTIQPTWRIKGNPPIAAAKPGDLIQVKLGPFDVLNLETDDATFQDNQKTMADLSGTTIISDKPVAVFSGVETTSAPGVVVDIPKFPGWTDEETCCLDHLEEQLFPIESIGAKYVITRSPIRSSGSYHEPDVIRFVGAAEDSMITTSLPAPYDSFLLKNGEVRTTWAQADFVASGTKPFMIGQLLISQEYVDGNLTGDPALTVYPPVDQYRDQYRLLTPDDDGLWGWQVNYVVFSTEPGNKITIDGVESAGCVVTPAGMLDGKQFESRRCEVAAGVHVVKGDTPFGLVAYGYGPAGSYAFPGGADVEPIYQPPQ
ncbi:MAG: IgGFc-binding protein [Myxococcales bacterium]|nr:IgGFc-binding protein [Myxococcales bacterium]